MQHGPPDETIPSAGSITGPATAQPPEPKQVASGQFEPRQSPAWLRSRTPARIALTRTGTSIATQDLLGFQLAHARARDAVYAELQFASLSASLRTLSSEIQVLSLHSAAANRSIYLQRPDLGRQLDQPSRERLRTHAGSHSYDLAIILADGLSALAVERHAQPLLIELLPMLSLRLAPICIVEQGRVAIGDEIGHALQSSMAIVLIGERPGLSSPDSLGAYITWQPHPGRTDAERNCISNIRAEGLSYTQAAARLHHYIQEAIRQQQTGIALKDPETPTPETPKLEAGPNP